MASSLSIDAIGPKHGATVSLANATIHQVVLSASGVFTDSSSFAATTTISATFWRKSNEVLVSIEAPATWLGGAEYFSSPADFVPKSCRPSALRTIAIMGDMEDHNSTGTRIQSLSVAADGYLRIKLNSVGSGAAELNIIPAQTFTYAL